MKKATLLLFFTITHLLYAQNNSNISLNISAGISSPTSSFSENSYASNGAFAELSSTYYFSKFGIGASIGYMNNPTKNNFSEYTKQLNYPVSNNFNDWKTSFYGIGPSMKFNLGNFEAIVNARYGYITTKKNSFSSNYDVKNSNLNKTIPVYTLSSPEKTSSGYYNLGVKFGYKITSNFSFYVTSNVISATSNELEIQNKKANFQDFNRDGEISEEEINEMAGEKIEYQTTSSFSKVSNLNYAFGISYSFGNGKNSDIAKAQDHNASRSNKSSGIISDVNNDNDKNDKDKIEKATSHNASRSNRSNNIISDDIGNDKKNDTISRAQDHNASRSNKSSGIISDIDNGDDKDKIEKATSHNASRSNRSNNIISDDIGNDKKNDTISRAQDHNASRSNKSSGIISDIDNGDDKNDKDKIEKATSHNASRSNRSNNIISDDIGNDKKNDTISRAQDHNASRSNRTSSVIVKDNGDDKNDNDKIEKATSHNASRSNRSNNIISDDIGNDKKNDTISRAQDHNASRSNRTSSIIVKDNGDDKNDNTSTKKAQIIISGLPKNNSKFLNQNEIKDFTWKNIDKKTKRPQFMIEVFKVNNKNKTEHYYSKKTMKVFLNADKIFEKNKLTDGQYKWKVTETTTGKSSEYSFFTIKGN